jgi:galactose-1-phosphate uridylyltransferase
MGNTGNDNDVEQARCFIKNKYLSVLPNERKANERSIYPHFTCSVGSSSVRLVVVDHRRTSFDLDSKNIRIVFEAVQDTVLAINLYYWTPY